MILNSPEYKAFKKSVLQTHLKWRANHEELLKNLGIGSHPKMIIKKLSESLLKYFKDVKLLDKYDLYQILMDYYNEVMQDDLYLISQDGWSVGNVVRELVPIKDKKGKNVYKEEHDFEFKKVRYKADLIPPKLIIEKYFQDEQKELDALQTKLDNITSKLESFIEEHSVDDGVLENISKKQEAQELLNEYSELALKKYQNNKYEKFLQLKIDLENCNKKKIDLENNAVFNNLKNNKGNITKTAINKYKKNLEQTDFNYNTIDEWLENFNKISFLKKSIKECENEIEEDLDKMIQTKSNEVYIKDIKIIKEYLSMLEAEAKAKKELKTQKEKLDRKVFEYYPKLGIEEIKEIVLYQKWFKSWLDELESEIQKVTSNLTNRIKTIKERYDKPLKEIEDEVKEMEQKVKEHLKAMGLSW
jgi:type I restriction enzyme M protein